MAGIENYCNKVYTRDNVFTIMFSMETPALQWALDEITRLTNRVKQQKTLWEDLCLTRNGEFAFMNARIMVLEHELENYRKATEQWRNGYTATMNCLMYQQNRIGLLTPFAIKGGAPLDITFVAEYDEWRYQG